MPGGGRRTLVIQSHNPVAASVGWIADCLASVRVWADTRGFEYAFHDDSAFDLVPDWYREKLVGRPPIVMDLARLLLLHAALEGGYDRAVWFDADTLIFAPTRLDLPGTPQAFGHEVWIEDDARGRLRARRNVHNAALLFARDNSALPFLIDTVKSVIRRADPDRIAPQMVGPKLLGALHSIADFPLWPGCGAFSPPVIRDIAAGGGPALDLLKRESDPLPAAANLCQSLEAETGPKTLAKAVAALLSGNALP